MTTASENETPAERSTRRRNLIVTLAVFAAFLGTCGQIAQRDPLGVVSFVVVMACLAAFFAPERAQ